MKELAELYRRTGQSLPRELSAEVPHKFSARKKCVDGHSFSSTLEARAYQILKTWQDAGSIENLELQPRFLLQPAFKRDGKTIRAMYYTADFAFLRPGESQRHVIETKGFRTQAYTLRLKLFLARYPNLHFAEWDKQKVKELFG